MLVKIAKYLVFCVYRRSYLIGSPVILIRMRATLTEATRNTPSCLSAAALVPPPPPKKNEEAFVVGYEPQQGVLFSSSSRSTRPTNATKKKHTHRVDGVREPGKKGTGAQKKKYTHGDGIFKLFVLFDTHQNTRNKRNTHKPRTETHKGATD